MIIRENGEPDAASYQIRMLQTNTISGILECRMHRMDNCTLFYYDVTSRQALNTLYDRQQVGHGLLKALFQQLLKVLEELSSYLLDPEGLILAPDTVYLTAEPIQFSFCYLPGEKHSVSNQMKELMEYFLPRLNHREPETVVLGYGLYKIVSDPECSLEQIRSLLSREAEVPVPGGTVCGRKTGSPGGTGGDAEESDGVLLCGRGGRGKRKCCLDRSGYRRRGWLWWDSSSF